MKETWSSWLLTLCYQLVPKWVPTSEDLIEKAEKKVFEGFRTAFKEFFVTIAYGYRIRTIETVSESERVPIVLIYGMASGIGLWTLNLDDLCEKQKVFAIDLLGFGRSSRPTFPTEGAEAEDMFVESIEQWREKVGLEKFILLGHSFGGYLSASYTLKYPERVRHLILADPWGMPEKGADTDENVKLPVWVKGVAAAISLFNPLAIIRAAGPLGPGLIRRLRPDLKNKFSKLFNEDDTRVIDYLYHINAQEPTGEIAFMSLTVPYACAKCPMIHRFKDIRQNIPISIVFGSRTWMDVKWVTTVKYLRPDSYVHVHIIKGAGHHVYADKPSEFNAYINKLCDQMDSSLDYGTCDIEGLDQVDSTCDIEGFDDLSERAKFGNLSAIL